MNIVSAVRNLFLFAASQPLRQQNISLPSGWDASPRSANHAAPAAQSSPARQSYPETNSQLQQLVSAQNQVMSFAAASTEDRVAIIQVMTAEPNEPKDPQKAASLIDGLGSLQEAAELMHDLKTDDPSLASQILGHISNDDKAVATFTKMEELAKPEGPGTARNQGPMPSSGSSDLDLGVVGTLMSDLNPEEAAKLFVEDVIPKLSPATPALHMLDTVLGSVSDNGRRNEIKEEVRKIIFPNIVRHGDV